jgi:hypothetical protein
MPINRRSQAQEYLSLVNRILELETLGENPGEVREFFERGHSATIDEFVRSWISEPAFPAEAFNSTVQSEYERIARENGGSMGATDQYDIPALTKHGVRLEALLGMGI